MQQGGIKMDNNGKTYQINLNSKYSQFLDLISSLLNSNPKDVIEHFIKSEIKFIQDDLSENLYIAIKPILESKEEYIELTKIKEDF